MFDIHSFISDLQLDYDFLQGLKRRVIDQKHLYLGQGAKIHYQKEGIPTWSPYKERLSAKERFLFLKAHILKKPKQQFTIISLGCGNSETEKELLYLLNNSGLQFSYLGVDSSQSMLRMAHKTLDGAPFGVEMLCADFTTHDFVFEMKKYSYKYEKKIFCLFEPTFGGFSSTYITDTLANLLESGDYLYMDLWLRKGLRPEEDFELFQHYAQRLQGTKSRANKFYFYPLHKLGIPIDSGVMQMQMIPEATVGALNFRYSFLFKRKILIRYQGEQLVVLPEEKIELINIRFFDKERVVHFFNEHEFKFIGSLRKKVKGAFLFQFKGSAS